jgi:hypothetical protein
VANEVKIEIDPQGCALNKPDRIGAEPQTSAREYKAPRRQTARGLCEWALLGANQ